MRSVLSRGNSPSLFDQQIFAGCRTIFRNPSAPDITPSGGPERKMPVEKFPADGNECRSLARFVYLRCKLPVNDDGLVGDRLVFKDVPFVHGEQKALCADADSSHH